MAEAQCDQARHWYEPPLTPNEINTGCLCCSTAAEVAPLDMVVAVGFGSAFVTKDGDVVFDQQWSDDFKTVADIEEMAQADPEHDWRIVKHGPLHGETFQRQGVGRWVCIESNEGFA